MEAWNVHIPKRTESCMATILQLCKACTKNGFLALVGIALVSWLRLVWLSPFNVNLELSYFLACASGIKAAC